MLESTIINKLLRRIKKEKNAGYGGLDLDLSVYLYEERLEVIRYIKYNFTNVILYMEEEDGRQQGYNWYNAWVGDYITFNFE